MCGISIAINKKNISVLESIIKPMNDIINHRGPDDEGFYYGNNFALAHRRLSILDLSSAGHQPFQWKHLWITYNGEVYNYVELREELKQFGHTFKTTSDTEVIMAAYEHWGVEAFAKFNGMWSLAIFDSIKNEIIFCRDHFGIKPMFYTHTPSYFLAGSEIKQFTTINEFEPILNKNSAVNFLVKGSLNYSENTFFENVFELPAGHYLQYNLSNHSINKVKWYDIKEAVKITNLSEEETISTFRKLFTDSVRIRMRSDVTVGSCLSGGIDSSAIVSTVKADNLANANFATITSCFEDKKFDEQKFSDLVTESTGYKAVKVFPNLNDLWDKHHLDKIIFHQDQPAYSGSCYSEFNVFKTARENNMIVMLDGQGSDEYLCGYGEFYITRLKQLFLTLRFATAFSLIKQKAAHRNHSVFAELKLFLKSAILFPAIALIKKLQGKNNYGWLSNDWQKIAEKELVYFNSNNIKDLSIDEIKYTSIPYQLHSEDRNSMMFSIESRLPFLCPRLVEYSIGLDDEFKIKNAYTKYVLRQAVPEMPQAIRERKDKMGFVSPDASWMLKNKEIVRKELSEAVADYGIFNNNTLARFDSFINGQLGYDPLFFRVLSFNRFCKIFKMKVV